MGVLTFSCTQPNSKSKAFVLPLQRCTNRWLNSLSVGSRQFHTQRQFRRVRNWSWPKITGIMWGDWLNFPMALKVRSSILSKKKGNNYRPFSLCSDGSMESFCLPSDFIINQFSCCKPACARSNQSDNLRLQEIYFSVGDSV